MVQTLSIVLQRHSPSHLHASELRFWSQEGNQRSCCQQAIFSFHCGFCCFKVFWGNKNCWLGSQIYEIHFILIDSCQKLSWNKTWGAEPMKPKLGCFAQLTFMKAVTFLPWNRKRGMNPKAGTFDYNRINFHSQNRPFFLATGLCPAGIFPTSMGRWQRHPKNMCLGFLGEMTK